jgi:hypothetical protein
MCEETSGISSNFTAEHTENAENAEAPENKLLTQINAD